MTTTTVDIEKIEATYKELTARRTTLQNNVNRVTAARDERKKTLKETIDEAKKEGFDPDNLQADIQHLGQVLVTKLDVLAAELTDSENIIRPMLKEVERTLDAQVHVRLREPRKGFRSREDSQADHQRLRHEVCWEKACYLLLRQEETLESRSGLHRLGRR